MHLHLSMIECIDASESSPAPVGIDFDHRRRADFEARILCGKSEVSTIQTLCVSTARELSCIGINKSRIGPRKAEMDAADNAGM